MTGECDCCGRPGRLFVDRDGDRWCLRCRWLRWRRESAAGNG